MTASWGLGRLGVEGLSKKEKGLVDKSVMIAWGREYKGTKW